MWAGYAHTLCPDWMIIQGVMGVEVLGPGRVYGGEGKENPGSWQGCMGEGGGGGSWVLAGVYRWG